MTDSIKGFLPIDPRITSEQIAAAGLPAEFQPPKVNGVELSGMAAPDDPDQASRRLTWGLRPVWMDVQATHGIFKVRARLKDPMNPLVITGYDFSFNGPASAIGQNAVLEVSVPAAVELVTLYIQIWVTRRATDPRAALFFNAETAVVEEPTITLLFKGASKERIQRAYNALQVAFELHNTTPDQGDVDKLQLLEAAPTTSRKKKRRGPPAFSIGDRRARTQYLHARNLDAVCYLVSRNDPRQRFASEQVRDRVFDEAELILRLEATPKPAAVKRAGLDRIEPWRRYSGDRALAWVLGNLRRALRVQPLRKRMLKVGDLQKIDEPDRSMIEMHFQGLDPRQHAEVLSHPTKLAQQKYFSAVARRVVTRHHIDFGIPWVDQVVLADGDLDEFLKLDNLYRVPEDLIAGSFTSGATAEIRRELRFERDRTIAARLRQAGLGPLPVSRLGLLDMGPPEYDARVIRFDRVHVDEQVHKVLLAAHRPLYPFLHAHGQKVFGNIALDAVEQNLEAIERRAPIHSAFQVGNATIVVTTTYSPDPTTGEMLPDVHVSAQGTSQVITYKGSL